MGARRVYHGHCVSLLWQSKQARAANARVCALSQAGSASTGGFSVETPVGTNWIASSRHAAPAIRLPAITTKTIRFLGIMFSLSVAYFA
jgi:hypothetical protein